MTEHKCAGTILLFEYLNTAKCSLKFFCLVKCSKKCHFEILPVTVPISMFCQLEIPISMFRNNAYHC